jgi:TonB family protein
MCTQINKRILKTANKGIPMKSLTVLAALLTISAVTAYPQEPVSAGDSAAAIVSIAMDQSGGADTARPPPDFVDVDKQPVVLVQKDPAYPELALRAGLEGKVWVKIWVDKSGLPREVLVIKSDAEIFNFPALEAARHFKFTPALIKGRPVDVWVSVPFRFMTHEEKPGTKTAASDTVWGGFPQEIIKFARFVLEGGLTDSSSIKAVVTDHAQSIANGYLKPLPLALREQREGKHSIEDAGRKVAFSTGGMAEDGRSGYLVVRTEKPGKETHPHYHTIVMQKDARGDWKIVHWHTWHSSR